MNKKFKVLAFTLFLGIAALPKVHAFGIGGQFNFSAGSIFAPGVAVAISPSDMTNIAANWYISSNDNIFGLTFDIVPLALPFVKFGAGSSFNFTLGAGLYGNLFVPKDKHDTEFNLGLRFPVGVNLLLINKVFEIYFHVAPSFGLDFVPKIDLDKPFFPMAVGAKFWIR